MTAPQLAVRLTRDTAPGIKVRCRDGDDRWDYYCTFSGGPITGTRAENTYGYDVNAMEVTSQSG